VAGAGADPVVALAAQLKAAGLTVAVAESAAGGLISAELTRLPGSSAYFRAGIVAYNDASKMAVLGIPAGLLDEHGSVSGEVAEAMAKAAQRLFGASLGIGETSIAGPGGATETKPVGLSYVAVAGERGTSVRELRLAGDREANRQAVTGAALALLSEALAES
jgi:PncC family amidohydrolase